MLYYKVTAVAVGTYLLRPRRAALDACVRVPLELLNVKKILSVFVVFFQILNVV